MKGRKTGTGREEATWFFFYFCIVAFDFWREGNSRLKSRHIYKLPDTVNTIINSQCYLRFFDTFCTNSSLWPVSRNWLVNCNIFHITSKQIKQWRLNTSWQAHSRHDVIKHFPHISNTNHQLLTPTARFSATTNDTNMLLFGFTWFPRHNMAEDNMLQTWRR